MNGRRWTKVLFAGLVPLLLMGVIGLVGASSGEAPGTPHEQWQAAVEADPSRYVPAPLERLPRPDAVTATGAERSPAESQLAIYERMVLQVVIDNNWELYAVPGDDVPVRLTDTPEKYELHARLSPDGERVLFSADRDGATYEIYTMAFAGGGLRRLTNNNTDDVYPFWSPDGSKIVFQAYRDGQAEIYVMNADGSGQTRLTASDAVDARPAWSPDGQWIAFVSTRGGDWRLYRMDATGKQVQLMQTPVEADTPLWSPDGTMLAFTGDGNGDGWWDLWTMNADGSGAVMREASDWSRELVPWSWRGHGATSFLTYTDIGLYYEDGVWYWTDALLNEYLMPLAWMGGFSNRILWGSDNAWHPEVKSADRIAPEPFSVAAVAPLQYLWLEVEHPPLTDRGGSGVWGYEWSWQRYPSGAWEESSIAEGSTIDIQYEAPAGEAYRARVRAWDGAGNRTGWAYTPPLTRFENELLSRVSDNRGLGVPDVAIVSNPSSFLELDEGDGAYRNYTAVLLDDSGGTISWSHSGFGSPATRSFSGGPDWGRFEFDVVLPPADDVISNGDFGTGNLSGWAVVGPVSAAEQYAWFLGSDAMSLSQTVTIPADAVNATLAFRYSYHAWGDVLPFTVELIDDEGTPTTLATITTSNGFVQTWLDVSAWAGETVTVRFARAAGQGSEAALDDVSLGSAYPDVWVKQQGQPVADRGETVVLRLDYGNRSGLSAPDAVVTYALPAELALVAADPAPTSTAPLRWELGELAAETQGSIVLTATVQATAKGGLVSAPATIATPDEAITGNNSTPLAVWVGGRVFLPVMSGD